MFGSKPTAWKSKQLYHLKLAGGKCELADPDPKLSQYIDYYWLLTIEQPTLVLEVIPDTAIDLVLSPDIPDFAALYFPAASKFNIDLKGPVQYAGICYRSQTAQALLGLDFSILNQLEIGADTCVSLRIAPLIADIQQIKTISGIVAVFNQFWLTRLEQLNFENAPASRIGHGEMISVIENSVGSETIAEICQNLGVSERQFRRLSDNLFGLSPKKLQNVLRLQAALDELFRCDVSQLQDLYYDDSHQIRELKRLTGCTPGQIRKLAEKYNNP